MLYVFWVPCSETGKEPDSLCQLGTVEMAQKVRAVTTTPEGMSLIPRTNRVKERNDSYSLFSDHHHGRYAGACMPPSYINVLKHISL